MSPVLELRGVCASYGPFRALFGVSLAVEASGSLALLGSNGAGKTTVARVASGLVVPTSGSVLVDGEDLTGARPHQYARAGVAHAPEGRSVFATLTVAENLRLSFGELTVLLGLVLLWIEPMTCFRSWVTAGHKWPAPFQAENSGCSPWPES